MKPRKTQWKKRQEQEEKQFDLRLLAPNVMRAIVEKMSVEEHIAFRATCKYAHDEIESYWRSQRAITVSQLHTWFPSLHDTPWKLESISCLLDELSIVFNLFKPGNIRKLSFRGVTSVNVKSLIRCVEMATGNFSGTFFRNVGELDMRGCFIAPDQLKLLDELFPNLHTILLHPNAIMLPKRRTQQAPKLKNEVTHHVTVSSIAKKSEVKIVPPADAQMINFIREFLPDVRHVFVDLNY